ncbi:barstar family protein [Nonomuraea sp. NPDC059194]|uniref:barstar family protein n=1 Tax=Nonomuraea sp. NPDC059194 TaxID=3346764 RepID=UPI00367DBA15
MTFEHRIHGTLLDTSDSVMTAIAAALKFPSYFGYNLDALYDSLTDLSWLPAGEHVLIWSDPGTLRAADSSAYDAIASVLADAVADGTGGEARLSVLLRAAR